MKTENKFHNKLAWPIFFISMSLAGVLKPGVVSPGNREEVGSFAPTCFASIESGSGVYLKNLTRISQCQTVRAK